MSGSTGIVEKRELAEIAGQVGATDSHAVGSDQGFARTWCWLIDKVDGRDFFRLGKFDCVGHGNDEFEI